MGDIYGPTIAALVLGSILSIVLLVPVIATEYRLWGTLSLGRLVLVLAFIPYLLAIPLFTLLPIDGDYTNICRFGDQRWLMNLRLFRFADQIQLQETRIGWRATATSDVFLQAFLNVVFFVPLGAFLRRVTHAPVWLTIAMGFLTSLAIETTQLTGNWGLTACQYRYFDVDDLFLNTSGTVIGIILAPMLAVIPGTELRMADRKRARPVTRLRRLVQLFCDGLLFTLIVLGGQVVATIVLAIVDVPAAENELDALIVLGTALTLFVLIPLVGSGVTLGERTVLIRVTARDGTPAAPWRVLVKGMVGWGVVGIGFALSALGVAYAREVAYAWSGIALIVTVIDPRGLSCLLSGLRRGDAREADASRETEPDRGSPTFL